MAGSTKGELLTVAEASIELGVSLKTCYRWINESKKLKAYRGPRLDGRGGAIFEVPVEEVLKHKRVSVNCKENKKKWQDLKKKRFDFRFKSIPGYEYLLGGKKGGKV